MSAFSDAVQHKDFGKQSTPRIRETYFDDYAAVAQVLARNGLGTRSLEGWTALWKGNPAYESHGGPIGWVLETAEGELVGTIASLPSEYRFRGRDLLAAAACDWAVDEPYRRYSLMLLERLTRHKGIDLLLCSTVSAASEPAYPAFRWSKLPAGRWNAADFWITDYRSFSRAVLKRRGWPLAGVAAYPVAIALASVDRLGIRWKPNKYPAIEACDQVDERFDEFWLALQHQKRDVLLGVRNRETLNWHLGKLREAGRVWLLTCREAGRIVAYAIFQRQDNPKLGLTRVRTVDFQALHGYDAALQSALIWMLRECRRQGIGIVENPGCWLELAGMPPVPGVRRRPLPAWSSYYRAAGPGLADELKDSQVWRPSLFDGDASL